jgi:hypothetical protein
LPKTKKRKIEDENRNFQEKWRNLYFVTQAKDKVQCLICLHTISAMKEYNIKRHYETTHKDYEVYTGKLREDKLSQLDRSLCKQKSLFTNKIKESEDAVFASYVLSGMIAKSSRPFTEGSFIKDCLLRTADILCPDKKKLFEGISLTPNTVSSRVTELANDTYYQLVSAAKNFHYYSVALDESTCRSDTAFCAVFIRGVDKYATVTEELLDLLPMKGTVTGRDVLFELEKCVDRAGLDWSKLVSVATDGAPAMCSEKVGLVGLLKAKLKENHGVNMTSIHCIIHQEALCGKKLKIEDVMNTVVKTINFIRSRSLNHRQFTAFLSMMESEYGELLYHTEVRWLSRGNMLKRFFALREEIGLFMAMKNNDVPELSDPKFIANLAFLTDLTDHLNALNLRLQGPKQVITVMYDCVKSFKCKLTLWSEQIASGNFAHFKTLQSVGKVDDESLDEYRDVISNLQKEFEQRFQDFVSMEKDFTLFTAPYTTDVNLVSEELQMELLDLQNDTLLKQKYAEVGVPAFYKFLPSEKYPLLFDSSLRIMAMFGSTYVCEQFFSTMKINKSSLRSRLTDEHLHSVLRLISVEEFEPKVDNLVAQKRCQKSSAANQ